MAFQALYDAIQTLRKRMGAAERSITNTAAATAANTAANTTLGARADNAGEWAAKGGPTSAASAFKNVWAIGKDSGGSLDGHSNTQGILIGEDGQYEVRAMQRGSGTGVPNGYITVGINGDRTALENRTTGVFTHDHTAGAQQYSTSGYIGFLAAGELVTAGPPDTSTTLSYLTFGSSNFVGSIIIRRIS